MVCITDYLNIPTI